MERVGKVHSRKSSGNPTSFQTFVGSRKRGKTATARARISACVDWISGANSLLQRLALVCLPCASSGGRGPSGKRRGTVSGGWSGDQRQNQRSAARNKPPSGYFASGQSSDRGRRLRRRRSDPGIQPQGRGNLRQETHSGGALRQAVRLLKPDGKPIGETDPMAEALRTGQSLRDVELLLDQPSGRRVRLLANVEPMTSGGARPGQSALSYNSANSPHSPSWTG